MSTFKPHVKLKKVYGKSIKDHPPFPPVRENKYIGIFTGLSVEVEDSADMCQLYDNGFYGKGSFSRGPPRLLTHKPQEQNPKETLVLSLEEAFFLTFVHPVMEIRDLSGEAICWPQYIQYAEAVQPKFIDHTACYLYMKAKGWVVKSGLKYGGDFLIYGQGPRFSHATFVVFVIDDQETKLFEIKNLKSIQRVAETSDKHVLLLTVRKPENFQLKEFDDFQEMSVAELVVERFNINAFVNKHATPKCSSQSASTSKVHTKNKGNAD